jgi:hypothetical protein
MRVEHSFPSGFLRRKKPLPQSLPNHNGYSIENQVRCSWASYNASHNKPRNTIQSKLSINGYSRQGNTTQHNLNLSFCESSSLHSIPFHSTLRYATLRYLTLTVQTRQHPTTSWFPRPHQSRLRLSQCLHSFCHRQNHPSRHR